MAMQAHPRPVVLVEKTAEKGRHIFRVHPFALIKHTQAHTPIRVAPTAHGNR